MRALPIVARELRVAARQRSTHWMRMGAALTGLVLSAWLMLVFQMQAPRAQGLAMFVALSIFAFVFCLFAGVRTSADSLSEEKREGTLGLLFLTDLKGYDIVFGKLAATSLNSLYGMLAVVPVMALPLLLGGVAVGEFLRVVLAALDGLFFSMSVGMFASAVSREERKAMGLALGIVLFCGVALPLFGLWLGYALKADRPWPGFFVLSPGYVCFAAFDETYQMLTREKFNFYYGGVIGVHGLTWVFLGLCCWIVPRCWQDRPLSSAQMERRGALQELQHGPEATRRAWRRRLLDENPILWLTARHRIKPVLVWAGLGAAGLIWLWGVAKYPRDWLTQETYAVTAVLLHGVMKIWLCSEACRQFAMDRKSGALELILSTPLSVREIASGQLGALHRQFFGPVMVVLAADLVFLWSDYRNADWTVFCLIWMVVFVVDLVALAWLGMWLGLWTSNAGRATTMCVMAIMVLPWVLVGALWTGLMLSSVLLGWRTYGLPRHFFWVVFAVISLGVDVLFLLGARSRFLARFRGVAMERGKRRGWWPFGRA